MRLISMKRMHRREAHALLSVLGVIRPGRLSAWFRWFARDPGCLPASGVLHRGPGFGRGLGLAFLQQL